MISQIIYLLILSLYILLVINSCIIVFVMCGWVIFQNKIFNLESLEVNYHLWAEITIRLIWEFTLHFPLYRGMIEAII